MKNVQTEFNKSLALESNVKFPHIEISLARQQAI